MADTLSIAVDLIDGKTDLRNSLRSLLVSDLLVQLSKDYKFPVSEYVLCVKVEARNGECNYVECKRSSTVGDFAVDRNDSPISFVIKAKSDIPRSRKFGFLPHKRQEQRTIFRNIAEATEFEHRKLMHENNHALLVTLPQQKVMAVRIGAQTTASNIIRTIVTQKPDQFSAESCYLVHPRTGEKLDDDRPILAAYDITQVRLVVKEEQRAPTQTNSSLHTEPSDPSLTDSIVTAPQSHRVGEEAVPNVSSLKHRRSFLEIIGFKSAWKLSNFGARGVTSRKNANAKLTPAVQGFGSMPSLVFDSERNQLKPPNGTAAERVAHMRNSQHEAAAGAPAPPSKLRSRFAPPRPVAAATSGLKTVADVSQSQPLAPSVTASAPVDAVAKPVVTDTQSSTSEPLRLGDAQPMKVADEAASTLRSMDTDADARKAQMQKPSVSDEHVSPTTVNRWNKVHSKAKLVLSKPLNIDQLITRLADQLVAYMAEEVMISLPKIGLPEDEDDDKAAVSVIEKTQSNNPGATSEGSDSNKLLIDSSHHQTPQSVNPTLLKDSSDQSLTAEVSESGTTKPALQPKPETKKSDAILVKAEFVELRPLSDDGLPADHASVPASDIVGRTDSFLLVKPKVRITSATGGKPNLEQQTADPSHLNDTYKHISTSSTPSDAVFHHNGQAKPMRAEESENIFSTSPFSTDGDSNNNVVAYQNSNLANQLGHPIQPKSFLAGTGDFFEQQSDKIGRPTIETDSELDDIL